MEVIEKLTRARIQIQNKNSFFAYLSLYLKFKEDKTLPEYAGAGVDINGNFYFKSDFFEKLDDREIQGVVVHEILHLAFLHLTRLGCRDSQLWNVATDLAINTLIKQNGFYLPEGCITSNYHNEFEGFGIKIKDVDTKSAEELYDEFKSKLDEKDKNKSDKNGGQEGVNDYKGFDKHIFDSLSEKDRTEIQKEWSDRIREAYTISQMKGDTPLGISRLINDFHKEKINWRSVLNQFISRSLPYDYTYLRPNKKSVSIGEYMPSVLKEKIEVVLCLDLSGSIGKEEFSDFFSEILGIARAYQERIDMYVYTHDTNCYFSGLVRNGNIEKLKSLEFKGCGGTSFNCVIEKLKEDRRNPKCLIWFTDGYGEEIKKTPFPILWVLNKGGSDEYIKSSGRVIKIE